MKAYQASGRLLADFLHIESVIAKHGPCTSHFISLQIGANKHVTNARLGRMRKLDRLHISYRADDPLTISNNQSSYYALGPNPDTVHEQNPKRGIVPFRPVRTTWSNVKENSDPLHAAFWGKAA